MTSITQAASDRTVLNTAKNCSPLTAEARPRVAKDKQRHMQHVTNRRSKILSGRQSPKGAIECLRVKDIKSRSDILCQNRADRAPTQNRTQHSTADHGFSGFAGRVSVNSKH